MIRINESKWFGNEDIELLSNWLYNHKDYSVLFDNIDQAKEAADILYYEYDLRSEEEWDGYYSDWLNSDIENDFDDIKVWIYDNGIMDILGAYDSSGEILSFHNNFEKYYGKLY